MRVNSRGFPQQQGLLAALQRMHQPKEPMPFEPQGFGYNGPPITAPLLNPKNGEGLGMLGGMGGPAPLLNPKNGEGMGMLPPSLQQPVLLNRRNGEQIMGGGLAPQPVGTGTHRPNDPTQFNRPPRPPGGGGGGGVRPPVVPPPGGGGTMNPNVIPPVFFPQYTQTWATSLPPKGRWVG